MSFDTSRSWVVVGACFYVNMVLSGVIRLSGIFFVESMTRYHVGRNAASFPYTFVQFMKNITGPLIGYLGQKFGVPIVIGIGSLLCSVGLGACFFAEDILFVTVSYGVIFGLGVGVCLLLPVLVNQHFYKYRAIASGFRASGKSVGSFILPLITEDLLSIYGLSGTFLVLSGLVFNCLPAAIIFGVMKFDSIGKLYPNSQRCDENERQPLLSDVKVITVYGNDSMEHKSLNILNKGNLSDLTTNKLCSVYTRKVKNSLETDNLFPNNIASECSRGINPNPFTEITSKSFVDKKIHAEDNTSGKVKKETDSCKSIRKTTSENAISSNCKIQHSPKSAITKQRVSSFNIVFDPVFLILAMTKSFYVFTVTCLTTVIVDFANDIGIPENIQAFTVMTFSLGELIGPLCLGWVVDKSYISKTNLLTASCFLQSLLATSISFSNGTVMLLTILAATGFVHSAESLITPLLVADHIPEKKQTIAIASVSFIAAPLCLLVSPLIGFLRDDIGSYEYLFYGLGVISAISGLFVLMIPCLLKWKSGK